MAPLYNIIRYKALLLALLSTFLFAGCVEEEDYVNTPTGNMEALWKIMDEHYCFFDIKEKELGVDWSRVHSRYASQINDKMSDGQLFEFLGNMIGELRDGHVNMSASFDYARNWSWKEDYPTNLSDTLFRKYMGTDYRIANGFEYRILDDNIGYIYCSSFEYDFGAGNLDEILLYLAPCNGLIIDVRSNGGGMITSAEALASRFTNETVMAGYIQHKTGTGHNDFSEKKEQNIEPGKGIRWQKNVCVLTNRSSYSATNEFVKYMKAIASHEKQDNEKKIVIIGDTTGGGAGMPFSSELPNGWGVRFSACPMYDADGNNTEFGIKPDIKVDITSEDMQKGIDTIIERARKYLNER